MAIRAVRRQSGPRPLRGPVAGYVFIALANRNLRMLIIGGPALLVALAVLLGMIREARSEARAGRARRAAAAPAAPAEWVRL